VLPAQVAGVALLTDYILTVAVSVSAGTAAIASAWSPLAEWSVPVSVGFIFLIAYGNLRGVKESGRLFAVPTYFFILNMVALLGYGLLRMFFGHLPVEGPHHHGMVPWGGASGGFLMGVSVFKILTAFANGGAAVTGVEAISNGVPAFRPPEWKNARETLVVMGSLLGAMFLGLSILAAKMHVAPYEQGTPTVISQIGKLVYGHGIGNGLYLMLQAGTALILILAANTSFADFPRLASFHAGDNFMPRQLTKRGHRLVFSNGIIFLAGAAAVLTVVADAKVDNLIGLYAIGVFTSFTLSQAGMAKHHVTHKEEGWRAGLFINGMGAVLSLVVDVIIGITKFTHGAWFVMVLVPVLVVLLVRLARQYEEEDAALEADVPAAATAPVLRRHNVLVFVDRLDLAAARAIQYARTLHPNELRAVHFAVDLHHAEQLAGEWRQLGLSGIPLEIVECPDRRLTRAAVETVASELAEGETEVSVLLPQRKYRGLWGKLLHDRTADAIERHVSKLAHANVTTVPFHFESRRAARAEVPTLTIGATISGPASGGTTSAATPGARTAIANVRWREKVTVEGRVRSMRVRPLADVPSLECVLTDGTGSISAVFHGRREIAGVSVGTELEVSGTAVDHHGRLALLNPLYTLLSRPEHHS
jgi:amino acid transporter